MAHNMKKVRTLIKIAIKKGVFSRLSDELYLKLLYWTNMGKKLDLNDPKRFTEKMQWLKLNDRKTYYSKMVDKYYAKEYAAAIIGQEYIIPTIGVWDSPRDIEFEKLPNKCVLKTTHDSGTIRIIDRSKGFDIDSIISYLEERQNRNLANLTREWPYQGVKPRIIAEQYIEGTENASGDYELRDYKFFCFNGVVKCMKIDYDRFTCHHANYYGRNKERLPFGEKRFPSDETKTIKLPMHFDEMLQLAEKLSKGMPFLRVDFYEVNDQIYFGEMTFYPASGLGAFEPDEWDYTLGSWLHLPVKNNCFMKE